MVQYGGKTRGSNAVAVGDPVVVAVRPREPADLRACVDGTLVATCPGGPGCTMATPGEDHIDVALDAPGPYQVFLVVGSATRCAPGAWRRTSTPRAANARVMQQPRIEVH